MMKIIQELNETEKVISLGQAKAIVEKKINNKTKDSFYIVKYDDEIISISGDYYKFCWKKLSYLRNALSNKFGRELAEALVENGVIQIVKVLV